MGPFDNDFLNSPLNDTNLRKIITLLKKIIILLESLALNHVIPYSIQIAKLRMPIWLFKLYNQTINEYDWSEPNHPANRGWIRLPCTKNCGRI